MIITPAQAIELHAKYRDKFRTTPKGTIDENETESVSFTLADMTDLLKEMSDARPPATAVKVYFGAFDEVMKGTVITRKTVFFQPAYNNSTGIESGDFVPIFDDIPFENASPHDVGHPCPPPKCDGISNY